MTVAPSVGVVLPATPFSAVVAPSGTTPTAANAEVVRCTNVVSGVWTITRAQEGSTARSILIGDQVFVGFTAKIFTDIETSITGLSFNVKTYGALIDGTTNDTAALAAALTAAGVNGGIVYVPPGVLMTGPFVLPANVVVQGSGRGASTIRLIAGSNADLCQTINFTSLRGGTSSGPSGYGFSNITLDANGVNQSGTARCYASYGFNHTVSNVWFINGLGGGVYSEWGGPDNPMEALWSDFKVYNYMGEGAVGVDWNGPHDSQMRSAVIATLSGTIRSTATLGAYGTTPFNGSTLVIPSNSANGGAGTFTFATTVATDPIVFPLTGGKFLVPTTSHLETYALITYTSAATVGSVTTFSGCTCATPSNRVINSGGAIARVAYGLRINGGAYGQHETGLQLNSVHIWGRNHIALSGGTFFASNCEVEGAFVVNVIMQSHGRYSGAVYGSNGQANQTNESGIQIGTNDFGCQTARVDAVVYNVGGASSVNGCSAQIIGSSGGNVVKVNGSTSHPTLYVSPYSGSADFFEGICQNAALSKRYDFSTAPQIGGVDLNPRTTPTYGTTITPVSTSGRWQTITVTDGVAFTIAAPTSAGNVLSSSFTGELTIEISNTSGGAMGAITWNAIFVFAGFTWANPASTKKRYATFKWNGSSWICSSMSSVDY